ncbi:hypothetical protein QNI19_29530 [Cytophagaceae bacterium DM2B3-1]|uniref:Uncharacterized protein n=1 Tax=Xanthocytophaga flava TaxID=3048013 RepID=A0ABT7CTM0_9BACT|nr:hypothetical protein [Xanthocytophaga flavus]MDJ1471861.1 hypothetical protein [Xanthocytophaga flavus]MDJ1497116.1 hypothetical protein [Xanthocytophaga flavus]
MKKNISFTVSFILLIAGILNGCGIQQVDDWHGELVKSPGIYRYQEKGITLKVDLQDGIVNYEITNKQGKHIIKSKKSIGDVMRWGLYWDKQDRFWALSSDIGSYVWIQDSLASYQEHPAKDYRVPRVVYDFQSSSIKDLYRLEDE